MTTQKQLDHPEQIPGYDYGAPSVPRSPVTLDDLERLKATVGLVEEDQLYLRMAGEVLRDQAADMVDAWRALSADQPHLAVYSAHPDGTQDRAYSAASHPRFARWVIDACTRPYDQAWLDYQHQVGLRHTHVKKNQTDGTDAPDHIPLRHLLAFAAPVLLTTRGFLARKGHSAEEVERMQAAWTKAVILHVTIWSRPYVAETDW